MNVSQVMESFLDSNSIAWMPSTLERQRHTASRIVSLLGKVEVQDLTTSMCQDFVLSLSETLSPVTVRDTVSTFGMALLSPLEDGVITRNPLKRVRLPKEEDREVRVLDQGEIKMLMDGVRDTDLFLPVMLGLATGMRRGEVLGAKWGDLDGNSIWVRRSRGVHGVKTPKTKNSRRKITLPDSTLQSLAQIPRRDDEDYLVDGVSPVGLSQKFTRKAKNLGFEGLTFHCLRHTHASILLQQGVSIKVVSMRLGHRNTNITLNLYCHLMPGMDEEAAGVIDSLL